MNRYVSVSGTAMAAALIIGAAALAAVHAENAGPLSSGIDKSLMDPAVRVQDDFYRHVNGNWIKATQIPVDRPSARTQRTRPVTWPGSARAGWACPTATTF